MIISNGLDGFSTGDYVVYWDGEPQTRLCYWAVAQQLVARLYADAEDGGRIAALLPSFAYSLHERVAQVLGWSADQTRGYSLRALRDLVRYKDGALGRDIETAIEQLRGLV